MAKNTISFDIPEGPISFTILSGSDIPKTTREHRGQSVIAFPARIALWI